MKALLIRFQTSEIEQVKQGKTLYISGYYPNITIPALCFLQNDDTKEIVGHFTLDKVEKLNLNKYREIEQQLFEKKKSITRKLGYDTGQLYLRKFSDLKLQKENIPYRKMWARWTFVEV